MRFVHFSKHSGLRMYITLEDMSTSHDEIVCGKCYSNERVMSVVQFASDRINDKCKHISKRNAENIINIMPVRSHLFTPAFK